MLPYLLALVMATAGLAIYATAFFFPKLYRKNDLIWSGVALFYALVLWFCAKRLTGAVLLGQAASMALMGWLGYQAAQFRWSQLPVEDRSQIADGSSLKEGLSRLKTTDWKAVAQSTSSKLKDASNAVISSTAGTNSGGSTPKSASEKTSGSTPIAAVTDAIAKAKGLVQGRKTHGKKYVRPEEPETPAATMTSEPDHSEPADSQSNNSDPISTESESAESSESTESQSTQATQPEGVADETVNVEAVASEPAPEEEIPVEEDTTDEWDEEETETELEAEPEVEEESEEEETIEESTIDESTIDESIDASEAIAEEDYSQEVPEEDYSQEVPEEDYSQEPVDEGSDESDGKV